jgi:hypothetical protein
VCAILQCGQANGKNNQKYKPNATVHATEQKGPDGPAQTTIHARRPFKRDNRKKKKKGHLITATKINKNNKKKKQP